MNKTTNWADTALFLTKLHFPKYLYLHFVESCDGLTWWAVVQCQTPLSSISYLFGENLFFQLFFEAKLREIRPRFIECVRKWKLRLCYCMLLLGMRYWWNFIYLHSCLLFLPVVKYLTFLTTTCLMTDDTHQRTPRWDRTHDLKDLE